VSNRVALDHSYSAADFNVPADGPMDLAAAKFCYTRPLKLYFSDRAALGQWFDACMRAFPAGFDPNGPSAFYERMANGTYRDVTPDGELRPEDYGRTEKDLFP
jgi:hypothetical protein